jgi:hypothetical protein
MPKIYQIFKTSGISLKEIKLMGLDLKKHGPAGLALSYHIKRVPTLVALAPNSGIGCITKHPQRTLEKDLLTVLQG